MPESQVIASKEEARFFPYAGLFHYVRKSFYEAGQDSYTQPLAQNPDLFEKLYNVEPVTAGILERRRGYSLFANTAPTGTLFLQSIVRTSNVVYCYTAVPHGFAVGETVTISGVTGMSTSPNGAQTVTTVPGPTEFTFAQSGPDESGSGGSVTGGLPFSEAYAYRNETTGTRYEVFSSPTLIQALDEKGNIVNPAVFSPSAEGNIVRMMNSRDYGFFRTGVAADLKKWDGSIGSGSPGITNWGIANPASGTTTPPAAGPSSPTTFSATGWTNPANMASPTLWATSTVYGNESVNSLIGTGFGFTGIGSFNTITVSFNYRQIGTPTGAGTGGTTINTRLVVGGVPVGYFKTSIVTDWANNTVPLSWSFSAANWGYPSLTVAQIEAANFGVEFNVEFANATGYTFSIDNVTITVGASASTLTLVTTGSGDITLLSGRVYTYCFLNSKSGTTSDIGPFSLSTGPLTNNDVVISGIPVSSDPQVDTVLLLATADGGDETTLYLDGSVPNGTTTYTDNMADSSTTGGLSLLLQPLYQDTDIYGNFHGVVSNDPPPNADFPTYHKGRVYMAKGNTLYFSKNLDDALTGTGTITTRWEEAWPPANTLDVSTQAETIAGMLSDGETLWIATEKCIRRLIGDGPQNFQDPEIQFNEAGLLRQEVWKVTFYEGQPVGTIWLTPDARVIASDFNTYQDIGTPIQDVLDSINRSAISTCHAAFYSQGSEDVYVLYIPTGTATTPNTACVFNLRTKTWGVWQPTDSPTASLFNIDINGNPQWLFATQAGPIYYWDSTVRQDRSGGTPVSYPVTILSTWLDMGDISLRKCLNMMTIETSDTALTLAVNGSNQAAITGFSPAVVIPATTISVGPIGGEYFVPLAGAASAWRFYQFEWTSPASTTLGILEGYNVEAIPVHRM